MQSRWIFWLGIGFSISYEPVLGGDQFLLLLDSGRPRILSPSSCPQDAFQSLPPRLICLPPSFYSSSWAPGIWGSVSPPAGLHHRQWRGCFRPWHRSHPDDQQQYPIGLPLHGLQGFLKHSCCLWGLWTPSPRRWKGGQKKALGNHAGRFRQQGVGWVMKAWSSLTVIVPSAFSLPPLWCHRRDDHTQVTCMSINQW